VPFCDLIIFLNLQWPGLSGIKLLREVRKMPRIRPLAGNFAALLYSIGLLGVINGIPAPFLLVGIVWVASDSSVMQNQPSSIKFCAF